MSVCPWRRVPSRSRDQTNQVGISLLCIAPAVVTGGTTKESVFTRDPQSTADLLYGSKANGWLTWHFARTGIDASTNGYFTSYGCDRASDLTNMASPSGTPAITNWLDALNRLTNRLDGLG